MEFNVFAMVVAIVLVTTAGGAYNQYLKAQAKRYQSESGDELNALVDDLRARVETLEKIVTDQKYQLASEINRLEDRA